MTIAALSTALDVCTCKVITIPAALFWTLLMITKYWVLVACLDTGAFVCIQKLQYILLGSWCVSPWACSASTISLENLLDGIYKWGPFVFSELWTQVQSMDGNHKHHHTIWHTVSTVYPESVTSTVFSVSWIAAKWAKCITLHCMIEELVQASGRDGHQLSHSSSVMNVWDLKVTTYVINPITWTSSIVII